MLRGNARMIAERANFLSAVSIHDDLIVIHLRLPPRDRRLCTQQSVNRLTDAVQVDVDMGAIVVLVFLPEESD